jgi:hypothetical protein
MSKSGIPIVSDVAKLGGKFLKTPKMPEPEALPVRGGPADPEIQKRATVDFATRDAMVQRQAAAAGAVRSENDADLLGTVGTKKRGAARKVLGV